MPELRERPLRELEDDSSGPGVFYGKLRGTERQAPNGERVVAWYAWVDKVVRNSKNHTTTRLCTAHELDQLSLEDGAARVTLDVATGELYAAAPNNFAAPQPGAFTLVGTVTEGPVPAAMLERAECKSAGNGTLEYHQVAWSSGTDVVVSGCRAGGNLARCGGPVDFMTSECNATGDSTCHDARGGVEGLLKYWSSGVRWTSGLLALLVGVFIAILGGVNLWRHRTLQRRRRSIAKVG